ncbi:MAG: hypothetical protein QF755_00340 [Candidatus Peribacteraceae bacterium]|jgi:ATP phosphoribosyltransferase|nr:hypothetical protein [Candidatus Peribacteraceae bacterium]|tara:strand:+ start:1202 stop:1870 length:669 start_codon:yes stop_codon:yes gene_type:complete
MHFPERREPFEGERWMRFAVPRGSLEAPVMEQLKSAGCRMYDAEGRDGLCGEFGTSISLHKRDRRMIHPLVKVGNFHAGITGKDICMEQGNGVCIQGLLPSPVTKWVLAAPEGFKPCGIVPTGCEMPTFADIVMPNLADWSGYRIVRIEGDEECVIHDGLCRAIVVPTVTGRSLREKPKRPLAIVSGGDNLFESRPCVVSKYEMSNRDFPELSVLIERLVKD